MKEIVISSTLPVINGNFDEIKAELTEQLKQFDLIVDESSVKTAKSMATQINKLSKEIDDLRKKEIAKLSAPLKEFEAKMKELKNLCQDSRQNLISQVKVFEDKKRDRVLELLTILKSEVEAKYGIKEGFEIEIPFDLAILSNLTKNGLSKKARDEIEARVLAKKRLQEKIDTRLLTLEAICFKSGLNTPLTRENINHFLMVDSDDEYLDKLTSLIHNELRRLQESEARRARAEEGATTNVAVSQNNSAYQQKTQPQQKQSVTQRFMKNAKEFLPQKKKYIVTATFEVEVDENIGDKLEAMMLQKFRSSGFKTTPKVTVSVQ